MHLQLQQQQQQQQLKVLSEGLVGCAAQPAHQADAEGTQRIMAQHTQSLRSLRRPDAALPDPFRAGLLCSVLPCNAALPHVKRII